MLNWLPKVFVLVTLTHGNIITAENDVKGEYVGYIEKGHPDNHPEAENEKAYFAQDQPQQGEFETEYEEEEQPDRLDEPTHNLFIHFSREIRKDANKLKNTLESLVQRNLHNYSHIHYEVEAFMHKYISRYFSHDIHNELYCNTLFDVLDEDQMNFFSRKLSKNLICEEHVYTTLTKDLIDQNIGKINRSAGIDAMLQTIYGTTILKDHPRIAQYGCTAFFNLSIQNQVTFLNACEANEDSNACERECDEIESKIVNAAVSSILPDLESRNNRNLSVLYERTLTTLRQNGLTQINQQIFCSAFKTQLSILAGHHEPDDELNDTAPALTSHQTIDDYCQASSRAGTPICSTQCFTSHGRTILGATISKSFVYGIVYTLLLLICVQKFILPIFHCRRSRQHVNALEIRAQTMNEYGKNTIDAQISINAGTTGQIYTKTSKSTNLQE